MSGLYRDFWLVVLIRYWLHQTSGLGFEYQKPVIIDVIPDLTSGHSNLPSRLFPPSEENAKLSFDPIRQPHRRVLFEEINTILQDVVWNVGGNERPVGFGQHRLALLVLQVSGDCWVFRRQGVNGNWSISFHTV